MGQKNVTVRFASIQAFYWMAFSSVSAFSSVYLLDAGLSNSAIGILIAVAGAISGILQPVIATYADRPGSASLRTILAVISGTAAFLAAGLIVNNESSVLLCVLLYWAEIVLLQIAQPMLNALSMACINQGMKLDFGAARAVGSLGYAVISWGLGEMVAAHGSGIVPVSILLCFATVAVLTMLIPFHKLKESDAAAGKAKKEQADCQPVIDASPVAFFGRHKHFGIVLIGLVFALVGQVLISNFTLQIVTEKGGGSAEMGIATAIQAIAELPIMCLFSFVVKKVKSHILFRIAPVFIFIKVLLTLLVTNIPGFYIIQLTQMLGWPLYCVAGVYYVNELMDDHDSVKGQAYLTMSYSAACVIASILGGWLIDMVNVNSMLLFGTVVALIGAAIIIAAAEKTER